MVLDGQRMGDERDWVLVGFFVTCSSSAEKRFIRPAKQDEMGLWSVASSQNVERGRAGGQRADHVIGSSLRAKPHFVPEGTISAMFSSGQEIRSRASGVLLLPDSPRR